MCTKSTTRNANKLLPKRMKNIAVPFLACFWSYISTTSFHFCWSDQTRRINFHFLPFLSISEDDAMCLSWELLWPTKASFVRSMKIVGKISQSRESEEEKVGRQIYSLLFNFLTHCEACFRMGKFIIRDHQSTFTSGCTEGGSLWIAMYQPIAPQIIIRWNEFHESEEKNHAIPFFAINKVSMIPQP